MRIDPALDWGEAPPPYPSLENENGAAHWLDQFGPWLGAVVDGETTGQPSSSADGDNLSGHNDEDGVPDESHSPKT